MKYNRKQKPYKINSIKPTIINDFLNDKDNKHNKINKNAKFNKKYDYYDDINENEGLDEDLEDIKNNIKF